MTTTDGVGEMRSYLASEALFGVMKDLESKNLVIPLVGDFAGPKALRSVGRYIKDKEPGATVGAFYLSNVEQYLGQNGLWQTFCNNVASLPLNDRAASSTVKAAPAAAAGAAAASASCHRPMLAGRQIVRLLGGRAGDVRRPGPVKRALVAPSLAPAPLAPARRRSGAAQRRGVLEAHHGDHPSRAATFATRTSRTSPRTSSGFSTSSRI